MQWVTIQRAVIQCSEPRKGGHFLRFSFRVACIYICVYTHSHTSESNTTKNTVVLMKCVGQSRTVRRPHTLTHTHTGALLKTTPAIATDAETAKRFVRPESNSRPMAPSVCAKLRSTDRCIDGETPRASNACARRTHARLRERRRRRERSRTSKGAPIARVHVSCRCVGEEMSGCRGSANQ